MDWRHPKIFNPMDHTVIGGPRTIPDFLKRRNRLAIGGKLIKGSAAAKRHMAYLRSLRGKTKRARGGALPAPVGKALTWGISNWIDWGKSYQEDRNKQIARIVELENKIKRARGGSVLTDGNTAANIFRGPAGWIRLAATNARKRKIEALEKQCRELGIAC